MTLSKDLKEAKKELAETKKNYTDLMAAYVLLEDKIKQQENNEVKKWQN
jgi:phage shock protein A